MKPYVVKVDLPDKPYDVIVGEGLVREIGWTIHRLFWGKGYAPEAARTALAYLFENLHAHRVIAFTNRNNQPSVRVMEKLCMRQDGCLRVLDGVDEATAEFHDSVLSSFIHRFSGKLFRSVILNAERRAVDESFACVRCGGRTHMKDARNAAAVDHYITRPASPHARGLHSWFPP